MYDTSWCMSAPQSLSL